MVRRELLVVLLLVCLINGLFSPAVGIMWYTAALWLPGFLLVVPGVVFFLSPLLLAVLTLLVSGVPAALYERFSGTGETNATSLAIWLGTAVLLSLPAAWTLSLAL